MILREQVITEIAKKTGYPKYKIKEFLKAFEEVLKDYIISGETVNLYGFFKVGTVTYDKYICKHPQTQKDILIPERKKIKFKASDKFTETLNQKNN